MRIDEASEFTGFSKHTIYRMVQKGSIPVIKKEGILLFPHEDLIIWLYEDMPKLTKLGIDRLKGK